MKNYNKYTEYTKSKNWKAICELNNTKYKESYWSKELEALPTYLEPDEIVFALAYGVMSQTSTSNATDFGFNSWLIVLTNDRFLCIDAAFFTKSVDTQSIRHNKVQAVSASQGWVYGKITIDLGSRVIMVDNCEKEAVSVIADLSNKWLKEIENNDKKPQKESSLSELENLANLHKKNILSDEEFKIAKEKILNKL